MILLWETVNLMIQPFQGTQSYRVSAADAQVTGAIRALPPTVGDCRSHFTTLADGMTLVRSLYQPQRPLIEETCNPHAQPMLVLTFGLAGHSVYQGREGQETRFSQHYLTMTSFHGSVGERHYRACETVSQLRLLIGASGVKHYFGEEVCERLFRQPILTHHAWTPFNPATETLLAQLEASRQDPLMQQIHALNLLALYRHLLPSAESRPLHPQDDRLLEQAREWMLAHLAEPFSLSTLAMAVGLSDYKLKQGFHQRFHITPGQMLLQLRMEQAHRLLEQGYQVAQAGWQVGYRHANNFSVAFHRYFGRHASAVMGKKQ